MKMDCTQALEDFNFEESTQFVDGEKKQVSFFITVY